MSPYCSINPLAVCLLYIRINMLPLISWDLILFTKDKLPKSKGNCHIAAKLPEVEISYIRNNTACVRNPIMQYDELVKSSLAAKITYHRLTATSLRTIIWVLKYCVWLS